MKARRIFVAGNWKMNTNRESAVRLAKAVADLVGGVHEVQVAVCPPLPYLHAVHEVVAGTSVALGAQNVFYETDGAFTGEVSSAMLRDCGCKYVVVGHSERRHVLGETEETVNRKVKAALAGGLLPIFCVGETLAQRDAVETDAVVEAQIRYGLVGVPTEDFRKITIAYEPVWAIGTGRTATPEMAEAVHKTIRATLTRMYGIDLAADTVIQYGGSVKGDNADGLLAMPNIDGCLVGGASLKADDFNAIVQAGVRASAR
ncbi:MAG: triose-phosphate isomerase [Planctomycetia bacterium]